jgi:AcrR family transcriptional regulator
MSRRAPTLSIEAVLASSLAPPLGGPEDDATEAMLDATSTLLGSYGMRRWSVDDVAARAGLGRATVYRRFDSRDDLVHATLARDIRRFFAAIAAAVASDDSIEDKVVGGFLVGLRLVRASIIPQLLIDDPATAVGLVTAAPVLALARATLVHRFEVMSGTQLTSEQRAEAELVAEVLVRLGMSFVLMPDSAVELDEGAVRRIVGPLLART